MPNTVTINGKRWRIRFVGRRELPRKGNGRAGGSCDPPEWRRKEIRVWKGYLRPQSRRLLIHRLLHEMMHAADWSKDEDWVEQVTGDMARLIDTTGVTLADLEGDDPDE